MGYRITYQCDLTVVVKNNTSCVNTFCETVITENSNHLHQGITFCPIGLSVLGFI